ncbi:serine/threonine-protein kinase [Streptomyces edwardsiae]|uniref:Serine/threonine-protein kinase n=1 Tax=Streptomyces edwardsiae TaxID=3075527 RepID=A0ABU2Q450_9ACTN|nr:serine/threonine-protein kinase [Streptomyces sp. DSM 41636]MDT0398674.1 serine/threonine-protein kinase [Streptomyces sp. DSM 41636]
MDIRDRAPVLGRWAIGPRLGRGGMGTVYSAVDRESGERCAVKVMRGDAASPPGGDPRVLRELRTAEALVHPHIVRTHACGYADGRYFLVMELCEGGSLDERVRQGEPPGPAAAVALFLNVLDALQHAHTAPLEALDAQGRPVQVTGVVHRDIKPHNLLLAGDPSRPRVKIADFGLAKSYELAGASGVTRTGASAGTPAFMPRQQVVNFKYVQPDVDVWAVAASLYFVLSGGRTPRDFPPDRDPWLTAWHSRPVPLAERAPDVPPRLARLVDEALTDTPRIRFPTAAALRSALEAV